MQAYLEDLFAYHHWANRTILQTLVATGTPPDSVVNLFSHLLNAHFIWLDRIEQTSPTYAVWQVHALADLHDLAQQAHDRTMDLLQSAEYGDGFSHSVSYQNFKGMKFENTVLEILTHVANHSTHHRAQVAQLLRQHSIPPPATDYIFYRRDPITP